MSDIPNPLPEGWTEHKTKAGKVYYYHAATKKSSWKDPRPIGEVFSNDGSFMDRVRAMQAAAAADGESGALDKTDERDTTTSTLPTGVIPGESTPALDTPTTTTSEFAPKGDELVRDAAAAVGSKRKPQAESTDGRVDKNSLGDGHKANGKASRFKATAKESISDAAQEYQKQVQMLMAMDKQTDSTGGKWLVR